MQSVYSYKILWNVITAIYFFLLCKRGGGGGENLRSFFLKKQRGNVSVFTAWNFLSAVKEKLFEHCLKRIRIQPIKVAAQSKAWTIFARSKTGIVGSNPIRGMDVCVRLFCVRTQVAALLRADPPSKES
jgi:hypothetical protein